MRAVLCKAYGPPESLVVEEIDDPTPEPGQLLIDVKACAINFPDVLMIQDLYQFKPPLPFSPGGEIAGVVSAVGDGVEGFTLGQEVFGSVGSGGLREKLALKASSAIPVPRGLSLPQAASVLSAYGTSWHALRDRADLQPGETLVVLGAAGGVGLAAVELGAMMGATVIAAASTDKKLAVCRDHGASLTINYETEDLKLRIRELTDGKGADVVYDPVGGPYAEPALRSTAWEGRFLVIGFTAGIPKLPLNLPLLKACSVVGVFYGAWAAREPERNRRNLEELVEFIEAGKIKPHVSVTYPLERAAEAIRELADRRAEGKVVVVMDGAG
jgi:NADPH2:quinone reductase